MARQGLRRSDLAVARLRRPDLVATARQGLRRSDLAVARLETRHDGAAARTRARRQALIRLQWRCTEAAVAFAAPRAPGPHS
ncbi:hypothetical protein ACP70R_003878 [Stipagrostis hirtigluma subsp. patula]